MTISIRDLAKLALDKKFEITQLVWRELNRVDPKHTWPSSYKKLMSLPGPDKVRFFRPFLTNDSSQEAGAPQDHDLDGVWSRQRELQQFETIVRTSAEAHILLVGPSGAGKSVFLKRILPACVDRKNVIAVPMNGNPVNDLLRRVVAPQFGEARKRLSDAIADFTEDEANDAPISAIFEVGSHQKLPDSYHAIEQQLEEYFQAVFGNRDTIMYIVFDQAERFLSNVEFLKTNDDRERRAALFVTAAGLKVLKKLKTCRTIVAVRQDVFYDAADFLVTCRGAEDDANDALRYFFFNSVDFKIADADPSTRKARRLLKAPNELAAEEATPDARIAAAFSAMSCRVTLEEFQDYVALSSGSVSNTFLIQLCGYLLEHFDKSTPRVRQAIKDKAPPSRLLSIFFEHLLAGFYQRSDGRIEFEMVNAILVAIAWENRTTRSAITVERAARLVHTSEDLVKEVFDYLEELHVIKGEAEPGKAEAYRFSHDLLFDHLVESKERTGIDRLQKTIERLCETRQPEDRLIPVEKYRGAAASVLHTPSAWPVAFFWIWALLLTISTAGPPISHFWASWNVEWIKTMTGWIASVAPVCEMQRSVATGLFPWGSAYSCDAIAPYYISIAIMQSVWIGFIFRLSHNYFRYILAKSRLAMTSLVFPYLGVLLGVAFSFTPVLSLVPIFVVGVLMGLLLRLKVSRMAPHETWFSGMSKDWGTRTMWNMGWMLFMVPLHVFLFSSNPVFVGARNEMGRELTQLLSDFHIMSSPRPFDVAPLIFAATAGIMVWFWWHIRKEQDTQITTATNLASFDLSRS